MLSQFGIKTLSCISMGSMVVEISSDNFPFSLTEKESEIKDPNFQKDEIKKRLDSIRYWIDVRDLDHTISINGSKARMVPRRFMYGIGYATIQSGLTAEERDIGKEDYLLYQKLLNKIKKYPGVEFEGYARDIYTRVQVAQRKHYVVKPGEFSRV